MHGTTQKPATALAEAVCRELRIAGMLSEPRPGLPLPNDVDTESELVAAIVDGYVSPQELAPLLGRHFYSRVLGEVFAAADAVLSAGLPISDRAILAALEQDGVRGDILFELEVLHNCTPACTSIRILRAQTERVLELWRQRQIIAGVDKIAFALRADQLSADEALTKLKELS